jgi:hypothetical protein
VLIINLTQNDIPKASRDVLVNLLSGATTYVTSQLVRGLQPTLFSLVVQVQVVANNNTLSTITLTQDDFPEIFRDTLIELIAGDPLSVKIALTTTTPSIFTLVLTVDDAPILGITVTVDPVQDDAYVALRAFLLSLVPRGTECIVAQVNRTPEPATSNFITMNLVNRERIATNTDTYVDTAFYAFICHTTMTVTEMIRGEIKPGQQVSGVDIDNVVSVVQQLDGTPGGVGHYELSQNESVWPDPQILSTGVAELMQPTKMTIQLDVHGPNSGNNAQIISTAFRDDYAVRWFERGNYTAVPLYADDPRQVPFINDQQEYEDRWIIEACLQVNPVVTLPQQFADVVVVKTIDVDATYPA